MFWHSERLLKDKKVKVFTDNTGVQSIMKKGSMKADLQSIAVDIAEFSKEIPVEIEVYSGFPDRGM